MSAFAFWGGFALLLLFLGLLVTLGICAVRDPEWLGTAEMLSRIDGPARAGGLGDEGDIGSTLGTGWPAGSAVPVSSGHAEHSFSNGLEIGN